MRTTPVPSSTLLRVLLLALLAAVPAAQAQTDAAYEVPGLARGRAHQTLLPWESIDTFSGGIKLRFVDFELPGDGGATLAVERTYDSKWSGAVSKRWRFGLAGIPMDASFSATPQGDSFAVLTMSDGTQHLAPAYPAGQHDTFRTRDLMVFRRSDNRLDMPSGLHAYYQLKGSPGRLVLTEVRNVYGLVATVTYDDAAGVPLRLATIQQFVADASGSTSWIATDGTVFGNRIVEFLYQNGADPQPSSIRMNGQEWTFTWNGEWQLESASTQAGQQWHFSYSPAGTGWIDTVTTPNGATIDYDVANVERSWVTDNPDYPGERASTYLVTRRAVTDPRGSASGSWVYRYDTPAAAFVTVDGPDGISQVFGYGYSVTPPEPFAPDVTVREIQTWFNGVLQQREGFLRGIVPGDVTQEEVILERTVERDGRTHRTAYDQYDIHWGVVVKPARREIESDGAPAARHRETTRTLTYALTTQPFSGRFMGPLVTGLTVVNTGRDAGSATSTFDYDPTTGFKTGETVHGIAVTFEATPDGRGNLWKRTDANNHVTTFSYAWGAVKNTATPGYTIERDINADGRVLEERRPDGSGWYRTTYDYDSDGRPVSVSPPAGDPTTTEYRHDEVIVRRGPQETHYVLNGLGDVIRREDAVTAPHVVRIERTIDAWGRTTFRALPRYPADGGSAQGTTTAFDGLHRIRWERDASLVRTRTYQANGEVVIREYDAAEVPNADAISATPLRSTTQRFDAWGDPDAGALRSVTDADGTLFSYTYNVLGHLASVTAPGAVTRTFTFVPGRPALIESETHPESGMTSYQYDAAGRRTRRTASDGRYVTYGYDGNDRLTSVDINGTDFEHYDATFDYDSNDNRRFARNARVQSTYQFDGAGRLRSRTDTLTGGNPVQTGSATVSWDYDGRDNLTRITYPSGTVVEYGYDRANRLTRVTRDGVVMLDAVQVHASGALQNVLLGSDLAEATTFDAQHRVEHIRAGRLSTQQAHLDVQYQYTPAGNVKDVIDGRGSAVTGSLGYDRLDRLTTITGFNRPQSTIQYDALGNRGAFGGTYIYDAGTQRLTSRPNGLGVESFTYDDRGNVTSDALGQYVYSPIDTLVRHTALNGTVTHYAYDADQVRREKTTGTNSTLYMVDGLGRTLTEWGRANGAAATWQRDYIYAGHRLLAAITPAPPVTMTLQVLCPGTPPGTIVTSCQVPEGVGSITMRATVTTSDASAIRKAFAVPFAATPGTASSPGDFTAVSSSATIAAGTPSGTYFDLPIAIAQDSTDDPDPPETFTFTITPPSWVSLNTSSITVAIADDDAGVPISIALTAPSQQVGEAAGTATVALRVTTGNLQRTTRPVTVLVTSANGSAVAGSDYTAVNQVITIPANTDHNGIVTGLVQILNDTSSEALESFTLSISTTSSDVTVTGATQTISIVDDDATITVGLTATAQTRWENDGTAPLSAVLTTSNGQPTSRPVTVRYQTVNGSAVSGADFAGANSTFTFPTGTNSGTVITGAITLVNDTTVEVTEWFSILLTSDTAGVGISSGTHVVTVDDDDQIFVRFATSSASVGEAAGSVPVTVLVSTPRGTPTNRAATVSYATASGTATQGLDYAGVSGSLVIAAGTPSGTPIGAAIPVVNDAMWEPAETFTLSLASSGAAVDPPLVITIVNDDGAAYYAQVDWTTAAQSVWENAGAVWISLVVTTYNGAPTTTAIPITGRTVHEWSGANPATPNVDYQALGQAGAAPAALTIAAGTPSGTVITSALAIANDAVDEPNEWFQLRVTPSGAASAVPVQGIWIYDDDPGPYGLRATLDASGADATSGDAPAAPTPSTTAPPIRKADIGRFRVGGRTTYPTTSLTWTPGTARP
jgi:YD repeat-containing protein